MRQINTIGVEQGRNVFQVRGIGQQGEVPTEGKLPPSRALRQSGFSWLRTDVMPANAGIHDFPCRDKGKSWISAFAGMTGFGRLVPRQRAA
jgi:hypothetical protein